MLSLLILVYQFLKRLRMILSSPELRGLFLFTGMIIFLGAIVYHKVEGWSLFDSFYFTIITLTTIGYGDFAPSTPIGKLFTILYVFIGLGVLAVFISSVAEQVITKQSKDSEVSKGDTA